MREMFNAFDLLIPPEQSGNRHYENGKQNLWKRARK